MSVNSSHAIRGVKRKRAGCPITLLKRTHQIFFCMTTCWPGVVIGVALDNNYCKLRFLDVITIIINNYKIVIEFKIVISSKNEKIMAIF